MLDRKRYCYKALVTRVIDGDTYDVTIDLGFDISTNERIRLLDIDTPETHRPKTLMERELGEQAKQVVTNLIEGKTVLLSTFYNRSKSIKKGKYGRVLAQVEILEGGMEGSDLGDILTNLGLLKSDVDVVENYTPIHQRKSLNDLSPAEWDEAHSKTLDNEGDNK